MLFHVCIKVFLNKHNSKQFSFDFDAVTNSLNEHLTLSFCHFISSLENYLINCLLPFPPVIDLYHIVHRKKNTCILYALHIVPYK